jgi:cobalamin biosynthesis protein CbiG
MKQPVVENVEHIDSTTSEKAKTKSSLPSVAAPSNLKNSKKP